MQLHYSNQIELNLPVNLIELIKEGAIVTARNLQPIYLNRKAKEICRRFCHNRDTCNLTSTIIKLHQKLSQDFSLGHREFVIDYQIADGQIIRVRFNYLTSEISSEIHESLPFPHDKRPWLLLLIEDRDAILQEELLLNGKKYGLSDREAEILGLLSQLYSYQDIARKLQISLNTVKFHVKNINAKKRSYSAPETSYFPV